MSMVKEIVCASCGNANDGTQRFCDECGARLAISATSGVSDTGRGSSRSGQVAHPLAARALPEAFGRGRYKVEEFLGEGLGKRVFRAIDTVLQREVAVSVFKADGADETGLVRARREAESMGRLGDHPNIVTVYDIGDEDGALFLVSQYMSGGDLAALLGQSDSHRLSIDEAIRTATDIVRALECAHGHGIVHRDIKPQNIWLAPDGTAKLGDFGLAIAAEHSRVTVAGMMVGTVAYMSPEQGLGRSTDGRSDLYALGAVLYEMLCGAPPFAEGDAASVISRHVSVAPVIPTWHRPEVPAALEQFVLRLLAKSPDDRWQSASEAREILEGIHASSTGADRGSAGGAGAAGAAGAAEAMTRLRQGLFLGRAAETEQLQSALDEAFAGRGRVCVVAGDAGVGKTRLATEIASYAEIRGGQVLWGRCYEGEGAPAYWPWVQAMRAYVERLDSDELKRELGSGAQDVANVVSEIRMRLPGLAEAPSLDPEQARFRLFDSVSTFLRNASAARPLAIVLDDIHFADKPSLLLLQFLARELARARIFLLCTYIDGDLDHGSDLADLHTSLSHVHGYSRTRLGGLSKPAVKALLEDVARQTLETEGELALVQIVFDRSDGNPYFVGELMRHLVDSGAVYQRDGKWVSDVHHIRELGIPEGVRDVVVRRLSRLSDQCRMALQFASVLGQEFDAETVTQVSGVPVAKVFELVSEAVGAAIVVPVPNEPNSYRFAHAATRDALYGELSAARRVELHQAIGECLEMRYEERIETHLGELAHHFALAAPAGLAAKAADYAWWAGERAAALADYEDAVSHFARALELFQATSTDEPERRCELLLALGGALWRNGDVPRAKEVFLEATRLADPLALFEPYARAALGFGGGTASFSASGGADTTLVELLRTALRVLPERDSALRVRVMARLAAELYYTNDATEPDTMSAVAVDMAERIGDAGLTVLALYSRELATMGPGKLDARLAAASEIVRLARLCGDREMEFNGHHLRLHVVLQRGDIGSVDDEIRECERLVKALRQPALEWQTGVFRAMRALMQGRFKEGERLAQAALTVGPRGFEAITMAAFGVHAFVVSYAAGSLADLREGAETFARHYPQSAFRAAVGWVLSETGDVGAARAQLDAMMPDDFSCLRRDVDWLSALAAIAMTLRQVDHPEAAEFVCRELGAHADECVSLLAGAACLGSTRAFLGIASRVAGRYDAAVDHFEAALAVNEQVGARLIEPLICHEYARTLISRRRVGDLSHSAEVVERGLDRARELGISKEVERLLTLKLGQDQLADVDVQGSIMLVARSVEQARPDLTQAAAPDGTVTLMFSDIENSTVLTERLGDRRWLEVLERHNQIVRRQVERHGGYEVKSQGDGFMVAFNSARRAIQCASDIQNALAAYREEAGSESIRVRIGLHTGEALRVEQDFFGKNVILAARIAANANGDQILVSALLRELVSSSGDFDFAQEREIELKGLQGSYRISEVRWAPASAHAGTQMTSYR